MPRWKIIIRANQVVQNIHERRVAFGRDCTVFWHSTVHHKHGNHVYASSKHAIEGLSKAMAVELAPHNIRVNTICPTFIRTPLTASTLADPERVKWIKSKIKLGRLGEVEDIMGAVLYLASDASSLVTGSALLIDGGWTAG